MPLQGTKITTEEWKGIPLSDLEVDGENRVADMLKAWKSTTGVSFSGYFGFRREKLVPQFWAGALQAGNLLIEVLPVGALLLNDEQRAQLDSCMSYMLLVAGASEDSFPSRAYVSDRGNKFDTILDAFCDDFLLARRRHVIRRYRAERQISNYPKGRIAFPHQCRVQIQYPGKYSCNILDYTEDVPENRVFKSVLLKYLNLCAPQIRGKIQYCLSELDQVSSGSDPAMELSRVDRGRASDLYKSLLRQSESLLRDQLAGVFKGDLLASSNIVFTSRVFELYISRLVGSVCAGMGFVALSQIASASICQREDNVDIFSLRPDIRVSDLSGKARLIIDVKWKNPDFSKEKYGVLREDLYQVLMYAARYNCNRSILLYPDVSLESGAVGSLRVLRSRLGSEDYEVVLVKIPMLATSGGDLHQSFIADVFSRLGILS